LPIAISPFPLILDIMFTSSSGDDVPKDTIVRPITKSGILNRLANEEEPSTSQFEPNIKSTNPITNKM